MMDSCPGHTVALDKGPGIGGELETQTGKLSHGWKRCILFLSFWELLDTSTFVLKPKIEALQLTNTMG